MSPRPSRWTAPFRAARRHPRVIAGAIFLLSLLAGLTAGLLVGSWQSACRDCPSIAQIYAWEPKQATKILDHQVRIVAKLFQARRTPVSIKDLPKYVPAAFIAVEDKRFYRHNGFDYVRLIGANLRNILHGSLTGGGSTITQ